MHLQNHEQISSSSVCSWLSFLPLHSLFAQTQPAPPNPYAATLDRLNAITAIPLGGWTQVPGDMAHGEVPPNTAMTMNASALNLGGDFTPPTWLYREIEIPKELRGYEVRGSTLKLDINVGGNEGLMDYDLRQRQHDRPHRRRRAGADYALPAMLSQATRS